MARVSQAARLVYIEPNDIASLEGVTNGTGKELDNIVWNPEDLNMSVDLQVMVPDVNDCGLVDYDDKVFNLSFFEGKKVTNKNVLTSDYVNIGFQEFKKNNISDRENLGINSIDISFDNYFFPEVVVNFSDVRGNSLMSPAELEYFENLTEEATGKKSTFVNLYKCLFHFPYPKFYLTVKGFYGTRVTFSLAVSDFNTTFNSQTGNFDITLKFKGHLYGLYTDIPMNYIFIAPYIDAGLNSGEAGPYWSSQKNFVFDNGTRIYTFVDFIDNFVRLAERISNEKGVLDENNDINAYTSLKEKSDKISQLKKLYTDYLLSFSADNGQIVKIAKGKNYYAYFVNKHSQAESTRNILENMGITPENVGNVLKCNNAVQEELNAVLPKVNAAYNIGIEFPSMYPFKEVNNAEEYLVVYDVEHYKSWLETCDGDMVLFDDIQNKQYSSEYDCVGIIKMYDAINRLDALARETNAAMLQASKQATDSLNNIIEKYLGFKPTIRNIFRMLFAHIQTFMHFMYEDTLGVVGTQRNNGKRVKVSDVAETIRLDISKKKRSNDGYPLPPFVGMYEKYNDSWNMKFPYNYSTMPEVTLVNNMTNAAMCFRKKINDILDYVDKTEIFSQKSGETTSYTMQFLPMLLTDYYYVGKNPYSYLNTKNNADYKAIGEIIYQMMLRVYAECYTRSGKDLLNKTIKIEACNFFLANQTIKNASVLQIFKDLRGNEELFTKILNQFIADNKNNLVGVNIFDTAKKKLVFTNNKADFVLFSKGVYLSNNTIITYSDEKKNDESMYKVFPSSDKSKLESFGTYSDAMLKIKEGVLTNDESTLIGKMFEMSSNEKYFDDFYKKLHNGDLFSEKNYRLYNCKKGSPLMIGAYNPSDNEDKEYHTVLQELYDSHDYANYRYPGLSTDDIANAFVEGGYASKYQSSDNYEKAYILLSLMPKPSTVGVSYAGHPNKITLTPRYDFLWCGAYYYKNQTVEPNAGYDDFKEFYIQQFKQWADQDGKILWDLLSKSEYETTSESFKVIRANSNAEVTLMKFLLEPCYIYGPINAGVVNTAEYYYGIDYKAFTVFFDTLCDIYDLEEKDLQNESGGTAEITDTDISENTKLSIYRTLKTLNDKWMSSYTFDRFILDSPSDELAHKIQRYQDNDKSKILQREWNSFLYVDAFYNDIGDDLLINPKILYDLVMMVADADKDYNLYQFIADLLQKNKMMLIPLPVYNNYYDVNTVKDIFTPHPKYDNSLALGNTFLCMYTYEPSRVVNDREDSGYNNDAIQIADPISGDVTAIKNPDALQLFHQRGNLELTVPAFGVTFGRQNQSYFTDIAISMDSPRTTDYGVLNTFELAKLGGRGFTNEPFAIGQDIFSIYSNRSYVCDVTMMGCANILPMMYFQLNNVPMFKGAYMVTNVSHSITPGNFVTKFKGIRVSKNQLPFNKDIFNINSFIAMVNAFIANGGNYDPSSYQMISATNTGVGDTSTVVDGDGNIEVREGDIIVSVNMIAFLIGEEGWTDGRRKNNFGTFYEDAQCTHQKIDKSATITVGPGLTNHSYPDDVKSGVVLTARKIFELLRKKMVSLSASFKSKMKGKNFSQRAIDIMIDVAYQYGNFNRFANCNNDGDVVAVLEGMSKEYKGRNIPRLYIVKGEKTITGVSKSGEKKFNEYWNPVNHGDYARKIIKGAW